MRRTEEVNDSTGLLRTPNRNETGAGATDALVEHSALTRENAEAEGAATKRCLRLPSCRKCMKGLIIAIYFLSVVAVVVVCIEFKIEEKAEDHFIAWFSAAFFVFLALPLSFHQIYMHLTHYNQPALQKYIIRIIWMVPIYAIESWFSLRFKEASIYLETIREFYEAYVIYSFLYFLTGYLERNVEDLLEVLAAKGDKKNHVFPFNCCLKNWTQPMKYLRRVRFGALQYVVLKLVISVLTVILEGTGSCSDASLTTQDECCGENGVQCMKEGDQEPLRTWTTLYCDGELFDLTCGYPYLSFVYNISQIWAMYCLVLLYHTMKEELAPIRPFSKFLCVKAVVFFSWWQGLGLALLVQVGVITHTVDYTQDEVAKGTQDWLICIEMFFAAIVHLYAFTYKDFPDKDEGPSTTLLSAFMQSSFPGDVISDVVTEVKAVPRHLMGRNRKKMVELQKLSKPVPKTKRSGRDIDVVDTEAGTSPYDIPATQDHEPPDEVG